jgi:hypothetical protein
MPRHSLLAALLLPLLASCTGSGSGIVLWEGYSYAWEDLSHRISRLRSGVASADSDDTFQAELGVIGGPWSTGEIWVDVPMWGVGYRALESGKLRALSGATAFTIPAEGRAEATVQVPVGDIDDRDGVTWAVVLQGFDLDMEVSQAEGGPDYDPAFGWTPQGLGIGLGEPAVVGDQLTFDAWMHFRPGPLSCAPGGDCEEMNEALPFAQVGGELRWTVLAVAPNTAAALSRERLATGRYYEAGDGDTPHPPIDEDNRTLVFAGEPQMALGIPLLRTWDFELNRSIGEEGRYLRAFSAGVEDFSYDPDTGEAVAIVEAYCSIRSTFEEGDLDVEFVADVDLLQVDDRSATTASGWASGAEEAAGVFDQLLEF